METNQGELCSQKIKNQFLKQFHDLLQKPRVIIILSHKNPDGDAVGSALGLNSVLRNLGHKSSVILPDHGPDFLRWLPGYEFVQSFERSPKKIKISIEQAELIIMVDFNDLDRLGEISSLVSESKVLKVLIDHHPGCGDFADLNIICQDYGSTAELIFDIVKQMGWADQVDVDAGTCLMAGIMTDTLAFRVNSSYPEVFHTIADLISLGVDKDQIFNKIYDQYSVARMRLLGYCLNEKMMVLDKFHTAYIFITREEMSKFNHVKGDTEGFVNYPLSIKGINFSVLFTEQEDHIKLSLRSKGGFPANEVAARYFNGGGHLNAAGGRCYKTMAETLTFFEEILNGYLHALKF